MSAGQSWKGINLIMPGDIYICPVHSLELSCLQKCMAASCKTVGLKAASGIRASEGRCSGCAYDIHAAFMAVYIAAPISGCLEFCDAIACSGAHQGCCL